MGWTIYSRPRADGDLEEIARWYEEQRPGYGDLFLAEIDNAMQAIASNPDRYPVYFAEMRRALVRRFPYKIFFAVEGKRIAVLRVLHNSRDHTAIIFD